MDCTDPSLSAAFQHHSPFLSDLDSFDQSSSPYPDFNSPAGPDPTFPSSVPPTPFTPSYAAAHGSYNNSPRVSDVSYIPGNDFNQGSPNPGGSFPNPYTDFDIAVFPPENSFGDEYDPSIYDAPDSSMLFGSDFINSLDQSQAPRTSSPSLSTSSLGSNNPGVSVSVTPAIDNTGSGMGSFNSPFDHGSPASSNGDNDHSQYHDARSRASSVSSSRGPNSNATYGLEKVNLSQSQSPPQPPQLFIPTPETAHTSPLPSPSLPHQQLSRDINSLMSSNSNSGILSSDIRGMTNTKGGLMAPDGPGINVVPATPISAGAGSGNSQSISFGQNIMSQENSGSPMLPALVNDQQHSWSHRSRESSPLSRLPQAPPPAYSFPPPNSLTPPPTGGSLSNDNNSLHLGAADSSRDVSPESSNDFLIPINQNPRSRSKSDTSVRPSWPNNDVIQHVQAPTQINDINYSQSPLLPQLSTTHASSFGPPLTSQSMNSGLSTALDNGLSSNNNFLSPDYAMSSGSASDLRRVRSEGYGHRRNALSADMAPIYADPNSSALFPPSSHQNFIVRSGTFLSPEQSLTGIGTGITGVSGAHRRTMSGGSHGHSRSLSRERTSLNASPYPSPHASPRVGGNVPLPDIYNFPTVHVMTQDAQGRPVVASQQPIQVVRQNVTTHATADASQRRRRTEANFVCPVTGCGSTFTRHFNLKGHLRSHNEERPFKCKWPGCDKGFARQHDCKRHEQLHLNVRPYTCQGCQRTFARMDALNRHLRSDSGTECQAVQPILTTESAAAMQAAAAEKMASQKLEEEGRPKVKPEKGGVML